MIYARHKFNWSIITRQTIIEDIQILSSKLVNQELSIDSFHKKITNHLKKSYPVRFRKLKNKKFKPNSVFIGGTYYSDRDQEKEKCIELVFEYPENYSTIRITPRRFQKISRIIADTLLHEIMHMRQYRSRKFKVTPDYSSNARRLKIRLEQQYLGNLDELDAYGFNIACELIDKFGYDKNKIIEYLNENQFRTNRKHNCWRMYLQAFEHDHNHAIIKKLKKTIITYLPKAKIGKPYKNSDWINR